jgi:hypothetical protein
MRNFCPTSYRSLWPFRYTYAAHPSNLLHVENLPLVAGYHNLRGNRIAIEESTQSQLERQEYHSLKGKKSQGGPFVRTWSRTHPSRKTSPGELTSILGYQAAHIQACQSIPRRVGSWGG